MSVDAKGHSLSGLQAMRAIAALMVVAHHAMEEALYSAAPPIPPDWLITAGAAGVDIFFVISGFIMMVVSFPTGRAPDGPWTFLRKRMARIYPLYWIAALIYLAAWSQGKLMRGMDPTWDDIARAWFLLPSDNLMVGVSWTLVHEMNFYALFALTLLFRNPLVSLLGVTGLLAMQLLFAGHASDEALAIFLTRPIILEFAFGLALGYAYLKGWMTKPLHWIVPCGAIAFIYAAPIFVTHESTADLPSPERVWAWGLPSVVLVAACLHWRMPGNAFGRLMVLLGDASYAIYLLHPFLMIAYAMALRSAPGFSDLPQAPFVAGAFVLSAVLGVAAHLWLERPLTEAARRLVLPQRATSLKVTAPAST